MEAIDKKNKKAQKVKALNKSQPSLLQVLDMPMISKEKEEKDYRKANEEYLLRKAKEEEDGRKANEEQSKRYGTITHVRSQKI